MTLLAASIASACSFNDKPEVPSQSAIHLDSAGVVPLGEGGKALRADGSYEVARGKAIEQVQIDIVAGGRRVKSNRAVIAPSSRHVGSFSALVPLPHGVTSGVFEMQLITTDAEGQVESLRAEPVNFGIP